MVDEVKSPTEREIEIPADAESAGSIRKSEEGRQPENPTLPARMSRTVVVAFILFVVLVIGSYLSWPKVRGLIIDPMRTNSTQTMAAIKKLDHRMARLEKANYKHERAIDSIKNIQETISERLDYLADALPNSETLINLRQKFTAMETTIANFDQQSGSSSFETLKKELESLKARFTELASQPNRVKFSDATAQNTELAAENSQLLETLSTLQTRLSLLENSLKQNALTRKNTGLERSLIIAMGQLRQTVLSGRSYAEELDAVAALSEKNYNFAKAIATLTPTKKQGIVTLRALADQFPSLARAVIRSEKKYSDEFLQRTWQRARALVTIRRIGEIHGEETDAILARTERRLVAGELAAAIDIMGSLKEPASAAAKEWLDRAKTHLSAMIALTEMQNRAIGKLADN